MSLEQSIEKLTAAIEAATGVLVALGSTGKAPAAVATAPAPTVEAGAKRGPKPGKAAAAPPPEPEAGLNEGLDGGLDGDDGGLGAESTSSVTIEAAKAAVLAYRDKAIKLKGKDEGLNATRTLMKKHVNALDDIDDENAATVHAAFTTALSKLK